MKLIKRHLTFLFLMLVLVNLKLYAQTTLVFEDITFDEIKSMNFFSERINGSDNQYNQIPSGTILIYQTDEGKYGKLKILSYGSDISLQWKTYNTSGDTTYSEGSNLWIEGTYSCDLDEGKEATPEDFWWQQVTSEERYLVPQNGAKFAIYDPPFNTVGHSNILFMAAHMSASDINGSDNADNQLWPGRIVVGYTNVVRLAKFKIRQNAYDLKIKWRTYNLFDKVTYSLGSDLIIHGLQHCDLDEGNECGSSDSDFRWRQISDTKRALTPQGPSAVYAVYISPDSRIDGFNWCNCEQFVWPAGSGLFPDWNLFEDIYGTNQTRYDNGSIKIEALQYFNHIQHNWGGSCFGFSHTCLKIYKGDDSSWNYGGFNSYSIPHGNQIINKINKHQFYQPFYRVDKPDSVKGMYNICEALYEDIDRYYNLCFFFSAWGWGHSVVPRFVLDLTENHKRIYVYDNNHPGNNNKYIDIRFDVNLWTYELDTDYFALGGNHNIFLLSYDDVKPPPVLPISEYMNETTMHLHHHENNQVLITDDQARKLGWESDSLYDEIPDCDPMIPFLDESVYMVTDYELAKDSYSIYVKNTENLLGKNTNYDKDENLKNTNQNSSSHKGEVILTLKEHVHGFQNIDMSQSQNELQIDFDVELNNSSLTTNDSNCTFVPYFIMTNTNKAKEIIYAFSGLYLKAEDQFDFSLNHDEGKISLKNQGPQKAYNVSFSYGNSDIGVIRYETSPSITINSDETQHVLARFTPSDTSYATYTIFRDFNSDGSTDDSLYFYVQYSDVRIVEPTKPIRYVLLSNYPNPFNISTTIHYELPQNCHVSMQIYDILGREITTLVNVYQSMGEYKVVWDGKDWKGNSVSTGIYIAVLKADKTIKTLKMLMVK